MSKLEIARRTRLFFFSFNFAEFPAPVHKVETQYGTKLEEPKNSIHFPHINTDYLGNRPHVSSSKSFPPHSFHSNRTERIFFFLEEVGWRFFILSFGKNEFIVG